MLNFQLETCKLSLFRRQEMAKIIHNAHKPDKTECQNKVALIREHPVLADRLF